MNCPNPYTKATVRTNLVSTAIGSLLFIPVLPNLIISTDETTIFCTLSKNYDEGRVYLVHVTYPTPVKNEHVDSGKCNNYFTEDSGDALCIEG